MYGEITVAAEIGSNWDSKEGLLETIQQVAEAGAHAFKIQLFKARKLYSVVRAPSICRNLAEYEIPYSCLPDIKTACNKYGLDFWISAFDLDSIAKAAEYATALKIASGDITSPTIINAIAQECESHHIPLIFSDGAATLQEVYATLDIINKYTIPRTVLLHCVSKYPALRDEYNLLSVMELGVEVEELGLSDHTKDSMTAVVGVAQGMTYFEKHIKPNGLKRVSPDTNHSITMSALRLYIDDIKAARSTLGKTEWIMRKGEEGERLWARRGSDGLRPTDGVQEKR